MAMVEMFIMGQSSRVRLPKLRSAFCVSLLLGFGGCTLISGSGDFNIAGDAGALVCPDGFGDCDGDPGNGCETELSADPRNCGMCANVCMVGNATAQCSDGVCGIDECHGDYQLCDGICVPLVDPAHCGRCGNRCAAPNPFCAMGTESIECAPECGAGQMLCDGACIDTTGSTVHCGRCGNACSAGPSSSPRCESGVCLLQCQDSFGNCDRDAANGCEVSLEDTPAHCGACENDCAAMDANAEWGCADSACEVAACDPGYGDCNAEVGCETDVLTSAQHCGACDEPCAGECRAGVCEGVVEVAFGVHHLCVLGVNGEVQCRGYNFRGQLGDGTRRHSAGTYVVDETGARLTATHIGAGLNHSCAIRQDGLIACWGQDSYGGAGNTRNIIAHPRLVQGLDDFAMQTFTDLATAESMNCAVSTAGDIWCWGRAIGGGGFGAGTPESLLLARKLDLGERVATSVSLGLGFGCAHTRSDEVLCWGLQRFGRIGDGSMLGAEVVPTVVLTDARTVEVGWEHACAISNAGNLLCWGLNTDRQLGFAENNTRASPSLVPGRTMVTEVSCGEAHTCAKIAGENRCWGAAERGALGGGTFGASTPTPVAPVGLPDTARIVAGPGQSCALDSGRLLCWGDDFRGRTGSAAEVFLNSSTPAFTSAAIATELDGESLGLVSMGGSGQSAYACGIADGGLLCWGNPVWGATGWDPATSPTHRPQTMFGAVGATMVTAVVTENHATAFVESGDVYAFGANEGGRVDPTSTSANFVVPRLLNLGAEAQDVDLGFDHGCALTGTEVRCWGSNARYRLGQSDLSAVGPALVPGLGMATDLSVGSNFSCAVSHMPSAAPEVRCWGVGLGHRLGAMLPIDPVTGPDRATPVVVPMPGEPIQVSAGTGFACAVTSVGAVFCWGQNDQGQAGGTGASHGPLEVISAAENAAEVRCYFDHACARMSDGTVRCWGSNENGELGPAASGLMSMTPVAIPSITDAQRLARGLSNTVTCVETGSGHRCWGTCTDGACSTEDPRNATPAAATGFEL